MAKLVLLMVFVHMLLCNGREFPGKIETFKNIRGSTFTWQSPKEADGGIITGFVCRIFRDGEENAESVVELSPVEFCFSPLPSDIPPGSGRLWVQVAAEADDGVGEMSDPLPLDIESPRSCPSLLKPSNGEVVVTSSLVGGVARYFCDSGFHLVGGPTRACLSNESWTGEPPSCKPITCDMPSTPNNTRVSLRSGNGVNAIVEYHCVEGYQPVAGVAGDSLRFCQTNGEWSGYELNCEPAPKPEPCTSNRPPVKCPSVNCGCPPLVKCPPPKQCPPAAVCPPSSLSVLECDQLESPENGAISGTGTSLGSVVKYSCRDGYKLTGVHERACKVAGVWTDLAPICEPVVCPDLLSPANGVVKYSDTSVETIARYTCSSGYTISGATDRICTANGQWSGKEPQCVKDCQPAKGVQNGQVLATGVSLGAVALYECEEPYVIQGSDYRQCISGEWTGIRPECIPPKCDPKGEEFSLCDPSCPPTCNNPTPDCKSACRPGCACPDGQVLDEFQSQCVDPKKCPNMAIEHFFELNSKVYKNGSSVKLSEIGEGKSAVIFRTNFTNCCEHIGECFNAHGGAIEDRCAGNQLYRDRGPQMLTLSSAKHFTRNAATPGVYCCAVLISETGTKHVCVNIMV